MISISGRCLVGGIPQPISRLALGTAFFSLKDAASRYKLLDAFVEAGGTLLDSGRQYGDSEAVIGSWLAGRGVRDRVVLLTKCAHGDGKIPAAGFPALVARELDASLEALQTDCVDLYLLHRDNHELTVAEILEPLNAEVKRGRVRAIGASNWEYRRLREAHRYAQEHGLERFSVVSNNLSLAEPAAAFYPGLVSADAAGEEWHQRTGTPLIPWSSQARGFFAGEYSVEQREQVRGGALKADNFTRRMLTVYGTDDNFARRDRARQLGERKGGYSATEVALAWLLHKPFPVVPVVGPRTVPELESCLRATQLQLDGQEIRWLEQGH